jgi:hypothetical protein
VVLEMRAQAEATLTLRLEAPVAQQTTARIADLLRESHTMRSGPFPKESHQWHRIVPRSASALEDRCRLAVPTDRRSHVYLRVRQKNGHMAWASPVFLNHR